MNNGHNENRLDRIENALEALIRSQSHLLDAQTQLEREKKNPLTSQILMQDELRKFGAGADKRFERIEKNLDSITLKLAETDDKLNGLIDLMDRHVREYGEDAN